MPAGTFVRLNWLGLASTPTVFVTVGRSPKKFQVYDAAAPPVIPPTLDMRGAGNVPAIVNGATTTGLAMVVRVVEKGSHPWTAAGPIGFGIG